MEPWNDGNVSGGVPSMTDIANGKYDAYLTSFAKSIAAYGKPTWVTFAHEQNGNWYPWGHGGSEGTTDAQWVATWKHVHDVMNASATNIKWVWAPNVEPNCCALASATWPGTNYVDIVGIDGYLRSASDTYSGVFGSTVSHIKAFSGTKPIWIAETGITPADGTRSARITKYVNDVKAAGLAGLLYFNQYDFTLNASEKQTLANAMAGWTS
jgi:beta-mannanase